MFNKELLTFYVSVFLFVVSLIFSAFIYATWDSPVELEEHSVEVNLPIINWERYSNLSKQYDDGTIENDI